MMILALLMLAQADEATLRAEGWAEKAKPIASCSIEQECDEKWKRATEWVRKNSRFQISVDQPNLFATYGAVYANTDLSFVLARQTNANGSVIVGRAWCGNVITCHPKPKTAIAGLKRLLQ